MLRDRSQPKTHSSRQGLYFLIGALCHFLTLWIVIFTLYSSISGSMIKVGDDYAGFYDILYFIAWMWLNVGTLIVLIVVYASSSRRNNRTLQMICAILVVSVGSATLLINLFLPAILHSYIDDISIKVTMLLLSVFIGNILYIASGILQLKSLSPKHAIP